MKNLFCVSLFLSYELLLANNIIDAKRAWANQQLIARLVRNTYFAISSGPGMKYVIPKEKNLFKNIFEDNCVLIAYLVVFEMEQMIFYVACAI